MSNTDSAPAPKPEPKRKLIADRKWLNDKGEEISVGGADVAAIRYTFKSTGSQVDYVLGEHPTLDRQFAAMGVVTKLGNIVNTIVNDDAYDGRDPIPEVVEWLTAAQAGQWREPGEGKRGPVYDKDVLAGVLIDKLGDKAAGDVVYYRERLDDKSYYAKVRANMEIMAEYMTRVAAKAPPSGVDALA